MERKGATLIEVLVVFVIIGVLLGLTLPAVLRIRDAALKTAGCNQLRQVALATLHYSDVNHGVFLPNPNSGSILAKLLPFTDIWTAYLADTEMNSVDLASRQLFLSPSDPSVDYYPFQPAFGPFNGNTSYAANALIFFDRPMRYPDSISDGVSNTVFFAEHMARCGDDPKTVGVSQFIYSLVLMHDRVQRNRFHRGSFSDASFLDVTPKSPVSATGAIQAMPAFGSCDSTIPQALHVSGMLAAMGDGSVRTIATSIDPKTFWSAVTPDGGEVQRDW